MKAFYQRPATTTARLFQDLADYHDMQDKWGATLGLHFDVAGTLHNREEEVPAHWQYSSGMADSADVSEFNEEVLRDMSKAELVRLGNYCQRLARFLDRAGKSY